jgi:hypothetical protein
VNKLQKSIENTIKLRKYEVNFYGILKSRYTQKIGIAPMCSIMHCTKLQELKHKTIYLQIYILGNTLNFCRHVHIMVSSSCKILIINSYIG